MSYENGLIDFTQEWPFGHILSSGDTFANYCGLGTQLIFDHHISASAVQQLFLSVETRAFYRPARPLNQPSVCWRFTTFHLHDLL